MKGFVGLRIILDYNGSDYDNLYRKQRKSILKSKSQWFLFTNGQLKTLNYITLVQSIEIFVSSANAEQMMSQLTLCREFFFLLRSIIGCSGSSVTPMIFCEHLYCITLA